MRLLTTSIILLLLVYCNACHMEKDTTELTLKMGSEKLDDYLPLLKDKKVGLLVNHTSVVNGTHLVDTLLQHGVKIVKIFAPEHGFRGKADAGEYVKNNIDSKTGIPLISLYGKNKKPTAEVLDDLDVVIFDIQDVGVRFYTYISSMHYMMEACAENGVKLIVLDRPNPNGDYFDGPVLNLKYQSFVGMHPIPVVHGLTVGELALMINKENWLKDSVECDLTIVEMDHYNHQMSYSLPIKPSPNLPNDLSIRLYPSLCFFEASDVSIGRGTLKPFQVIGYPDSTFGDYTFTPVSIDGMSKSPSQQDIVCYGIDLGDEPLSHVFTLKYVLDFSKKSNDHLFNNIRWFNLLAGNDTLLKKVEAGWSEMDIKESWKDELEAYSQLRNKYLLYPEK